jgi:hypothetical protein
MEFPFVGLNNLICIKTTESDYFYLNYLFTLPPHFVAAWTLPPQGRPYNSPPPPPASLAPDESSRTSVAP